jgi:hypothetical protein
MPATPYTKLAIVWKVSPPVAKQGYFILALHMQQRVEQGGRCFEGARLAIPAVVMSRRK